MTGPDILRGPMHHNFRCLIGYLKYGIEKLQTDTQELEQKIAASEKDEERVDHKVAKGFVEGYFSDSLRISVFLMAYALFEEYLVHACGKLGNKLSKTPLRECRGDGLDKYKAFLKPIVRDASLFGGIDWNRIKDASQIRHVLIHANGNLSIWKKRAGVESILAKYPSEIRIEHGHALRINDAFIDTFVKSAISFVESTLAALSRSAATTT